MKSVDRTELCRILGGDGNPPLSPQRISQLVGEGMPKLDRGRFDPTRCLYWYLGKLGRSTKVTNTKNIDGPVSSVESERKRLLRFTADLQELDHRRKLAELVPVAIIESEWAEIQANIAGAFAPEAEIERLADRLVGLSRPEIKAAMYAWVKVALLRCVDFGKGDPQKIAPATGTGRKRFGIAPLLAKKIRKT
jgi:hypothetical protein